MLLGGAVAATLLLGSLAFAGVAYVHGHPANQSAAAGTRRSAPSARPGSPAPSSGAQEPTRPGQPGIDDVRTDPKPLGLSEVFPDSQITLGGKVYKQDKTSVNHDCTLAARGAMAQALGREHCSNVVRATYVQAGKKYAVTLGIAALPTKQAALTASKAGDPSTYEWFRGLTGQVATKIDSAGGYSASTVLGRYLIYSYAQYADGTKAQAKDTTLETLAGDALNYAKLPIEKRAQ